MTNDLSRDDVDGLKAQAREVLVAHHADDLATERARDQLEQIITSAAGQLSEEDRRALAHFVERLIGAVWSDTMTVDEACSKIEDVAAAAAANSEGFRRLIAN